MYLTSGGQISAGDTKISQNPKLDRRHSAGSALAKSSLIVLPCRVPCEVGINILLHFIKQTAYKYIIILHATDTAPHEHAC